MTGEFGDAIHAGSIVEARTLGAFVDFNVAVFSCEAFATLTFESVDEVQTGLSPMSASFESFAFVHVVLAVLTVEAKSTQTVIRGSIVPTRRVVLAW